ncbi:MAG: DUF3021 domain-containing protein [Acutalibacter sp.]|nr:DUF3021 domain-containing protein [Acutalibacter sp.]
MKKFLEFVGEIKSWGCLSFTGALCVYSFIDVMCGNQTMRHSLIWQMLAMCGVITLLQYIFFSGQVLKKPSYALRMGIFCALTFGVCAGFAWVCGWFPMKEPGAWASFTIIFFVIFLALCLGFEVYFRIMGKKYDVLLGRQQKEKPEE